MKNFRKKRRRRSKPNRLSCKTETASSNRLEIELLEDRLMLSTIQVFAAGDTNDEAMNLSISGQVVQSWSDIGGDYSDGVFQAYPYNTPGTVTADQVRVAFTNDGQTSSGEDRNLRIDKIRIDGVDYESESPDTYIEGTWNSATGCSAGNLQSEFIHCAGFIQYAGSGSSGSQVVVRMAGDTGEERATLAIDGTVVKTWNNIGGDFEARHFIDYTYTHSTTVTPDQILISHTNDGLTSGGEDRNLNLDRIEIDSVQHEAEDSSVFVTGHWLDATGCTDGFLQTETTHCGGSFQFGPATSQGSTIVVRAAGATGQEQAKLKIDGQTVETWNNIAGDYNNGVFENLTYLHPAIVNINQVVVEFSNNGDTSTGQDKNLRIDGVTLDGTDFQAEGDNVYSEGHWINGVGCASGFLQTETLHCGGFIDFNGANYDSGGFSLASTLVNVDESESSVSLTVLRTLGSTGIVSVDYHAFGNTATENVDFTVVSGTLTFADGQVSRTITVPILNDTLVEDDERFSITIDNATGGAELLAPRTSQVNINDDDVASEDSLLAWWKFDESSVGTAINAAGSDNIGKHVKMTGGTSGPIAESPLLNQPNPRSLNFDGVNDYVRVNGNANLDFSGGTFTISAWIRPEFTATTRHGILYGNNAHYPDLHVVGGNKVAFRMGDGTTSQTVTTPNVLETGDWNHVAVTYSGINLRIFVNGQLELTSNAYISIDPVSPHKVDIGRRGGVFFKGQIDEVQVHNRWLNNSEALGLFVDQRSEVATEVITTIGGTTAIDWTPNGDKMFVGDFGGVVRIFENGHFLPTPFLDISDEVNGTRGMLDMVLHPDFFNTPYVYLAYAYDPPEVNLHTGLAGPDGAGNRASRVMRVTADATDNYRRIVPNSEVVLLGTNSLWQHFNGFVDSTVDFDEPAGGYNPDGTNVQDFLNADSVTHTIDDIEFGPDGMLYVSNGDGASFNQVDPRATRVQDIDNLSGKVLRIDPITGEGLDDNPFYNGDPDANRSKVYYYGFRNPYRMSFNVSGQLFVGDVGWSQYEELNTGAPGTNFGWPYYEGGTVDAPLKTIGYQDLPEAIAFYATNEETSGGIISLNHADDDIDAIIVGDFYDGDVYDSTFAGDLFFNHLGSGFVRQVNFAADGSIESIQTLADNTGYIVQMRVAPDGYLYFVDLISGTIGRWVIDVG